MTPPRIEPLFTKLRVFVPDAGGMTHGLVIKDETAIELAKLLNAHYARLGRECNYNPEPAYLA